MWTVVISTIALYWAFVFLAVVASTCLTLFNLLVNSIWGAESPRCQYAKVRHRYHSIYNYRRLHNEAYTIIDALADYRVIFCAIAWFLKPHRFAALLACLFAFLLIYPAFAIFRWMDFIYLMVRVAWCIARAHAWVCCVYAVLRLLLSRSFELYKIKCASIEYKKGSYRSTYFA